MEDLQYDYIQKGDLFECNRKGTLTFFAIIKKPSKNDTYFEQLKSGRFPMQRSIQNRVLFLITNTI